jgi:hypothetical protein
MTADNDTATAVDERAGAPAETPLPAGEEQIEPKKADAKDKKKKRGGKGKGSAAESGRDAGAGTGLRLSEHPRAARRVAEAKAWGGVAGFVLGGYLSLPTHTLADAALRALLAGIFLRTLVWAGAVFIWRRIVVAELRHAQHELLTERLAGEGARAPER